jgi:hypothetical protein
MPAVPLYLHRLADGIAALEALPNEVIDRRTLEEALGVGKWTAWRIMKQCGAEDGPGGALVCQRSHLLSQFRRFQEDHRFAPEIARRQRVASYLDHIVQHASRQHKEIARNQQAEALLSSRFGKLPPGVKLAPDELHIAFHGTEDLLQKLGAVVYALNNDFERIEEFIEKGSASPGTWSET